MSSIDIKTFIKTATIEQKKIIFAFVDLAKKESELCEKINKIFASIQKGRYSSEGGSISVCEDEDDALIISMEPRNELESVRKEISSLMQKALDLGMENVGLIKRNADYYIYKRWK